MKVEVEVALSDEDVARIAKAVVAEFKAQGGVVQGKAETPAEKPTKPTKATDKPKPAEKPPETAPVAEGPSRADVLAKLNETADRLGSKDAAMAVVKKFAPKFGDVAEADYAKLIAALDAEPTPEPEASGDGWE